MLKMALIVTLVAAVALAFAGVQAGSFYALWLTPDQQGMVAFNNKEFQRAADLFEDPMWRGRAQYSAGQYAAAAASYGQLATAEGFFNRGNALMKAFEFGSAISAYELAVAEKPQWREAQDNLALARYTLDYIEDTREAADTGDQTELSADDYRFDNTRDKGKEMQVTQKSTMDALSAEKWMRSVDTETADFLRIRFALESEQEAQP